MKRYERQSAAEGLPPPHVGEHLMIVPSHCESDKDLKQRPQSCRVQFVNARGRFFTVRYDGTGFCESFPFGA